MSTIKAFIESRQHEGPFRLYIDRRAYYHFQTFEQLCNFSFYIRFSHAIYCHAGRYQEQSITDMLLARLDNRLAIELEQGYAAYLEAGLLSNLAWKRPIPA